MALITSPRLDGYASLEDLQSWAEGLMQSRPADFIIGEDYLFRWWVVPRNEGSNTYLHKICRGDDDRALHDHPWPNVSYVLFGQYLEHTPEGSFLRQAGDVVVRAATDRHRLELIDSKPCISLFSTGPKVRDWGFWCPQGFVPWQQFVSASDKGAIGRGCGE